MFHARLHLLLWLLALTASGCGTTALRAVGNEDGGNTAPATSQDSGLPPGDDAGLPPEDPDPPDASIPGEQDAGTAADAGQLPANDAGTPPSPPACTTETCNGVDDDCDGQVDEGCSCPEGGPVSGFSENDPLHAISAANFVLVDDAQWTVNAARIDAWPTAAAGISGVAAHLNRTATKLTGSLVPSVPNYRTGFTWDSGDRGVDYWVPQGLTGGAVGSQKLVVATWHYDTCAASVDPHPFSGGNKGARISVADVTNMNAVMYRHALLVEPTTSGFKEVRIHAGGVAWVGNYLYVVDTSKGLRVFDLTRIHEASTASACSDQVGPQGGEWCAFGYQYVVPQVASYQVPAAIGASCKPAFSTLGYDWSSSPPALLTGEYDNGSVYGRLLRWPVDAATGRLVTTRGAVHALQAFYMGDRNIQGAVSSNGRYWLSATRHCGAVFAKGTSGAVTVKTYPGSWASMSEGQFISSSGNLWTITEGVIPRGGSCTSNGCAASTRIVFAVNPAP